MHVFHVDMDNIMYIYKYIGIILSPIPYILIYGITEPFRLLELLILLVLLMTSPRFRFPSLRH